MAALFSKYLSVVLASALKFFAGPVTGAALGLSWLETAICTIIGMMLTVFTIALVGTEIKRLVRRWRKSPPKRFSKTSRYAVKVWKRFGIVGIAFLTPLIFTPPLGSILAVAFSVPRVQVIVWMLAASVWWGFSLSFLVHKLSFLQNLFH